MWANTEVREENISQGALWLSDKNTLQKGRQILYERNRDSGKRASGVRAAVTLKDSQAAQRPQHACQCHFKVEQYQECKADRQAGAPVKSGHASFCRTTTELGELSKLGKEFGCNSFSLQMESLAGSHWQHIIWLHEYYFQHHLHFLPLSLCFLRSWKPALYVLDQGCQT